MFQRTFVNFKRMCVNICSVVYVEDIKNIFVSRSQICDTSVTYVGLEEMLVCPVQWTIISVPLGYCRLPQTRVRRTHASQWAAEQQGSRAAGQGRAERGQNEGRAALPFV